MGNPGHVTEIYEPHIMTKKKYKIGRLLLNERKQIWISTRIEIGTKNKKGFITRLNNKHKINNLPYCKEIHIKVKNNK